MDNLEQLSSLLSPILNDPEAMAGISKAAAELGLGGLSGFGQAESSTEKDSEAAENTSAEPSADGLTSMLERIMPLLSGGGNDNAERLLSSLRPFLHGDRAKKLDDAERIVKMLHIVTTLRGQGLL